MTRSPKLLLRPVLAVLALMYLGTSAFAQTAHPPFELNMLRPENIIAPEPKGGYPKRGDLSLPGSAVTINLAFDGSVPVGHQAMFITARNTWVNRIPFYATGVTGPASITINVQEPFLDGPGGVLGSAGPTGTAIHGGYRVTTVGLMRFDSADVASLISSGLYDEVIEHEMGHVLGIGTQWVNNSVYTTGSGEYYGISGLTAWKAGFTGQALATFVPVELGGGGGTANGHWNETNGGAGPTGISEISSGIDMTFELMTGWLNPSPVNYSVLTHRSMADIGYDPNPAVVPVEVSEFSID